MRLNLGAGLGPHEPGFVTVDRVVQFKPDIVCDLEAFPWPWADNTVSEIRMFHILEHLGQEPRVFLKIIGELHRILEPNGTVSIRVPHLRSDNQYGNFTHVRPITHELMNQFDRQRSLMPEIYLTTGIDLEMVECTNHLTPRWAAMLNSGEISEDEARAAEKELWNVVAEVRMILRKVVDG